MTSVEFFGAVLRFVTTVWEQVEPRVAEAVANEIVEWMKGPTPGAA